MKTRILHLSLMLVVGLGGAAVICGCDRDEAKKPASSNDTTADKASAAVKRGIDSAAAGANVGVNAAHDATTQAVEHTKNAIDTARTAVGQAAQKSGDATSQAGQAVKDFVAPTTAPTTLPATDK